jgi:predicted metal-dependent enzyme (double-stranded beta helix superfamily)
MQRIAALTRPRAIGEGGLPMCDFVAASMPDVDALITAEGRTALSELHDVVNATIRSRAEPAAIIERLRGPFAAFLARDGWLPDPCRVPIPGKAASYALLRSTDPEYVLFSMVLPAGESTKVHNHLAWGLIGLWQGRQYEVQYHRADDGSNPEYAELAESDRRTLERGDITRLLPPLDDIHIITTLSDVPSISIHLLGNDLGRIRRQLFYPDEKRAETFISGYDNVQGIAGADAAGVGARR